MRASLSVSVCAVIGVAMAAVGVDETFRIGAYSIETADVWPTGLLTLSEGSYFLTTQVQGEAAQQRFTWNK
jgi:hypothetical protein